MGFLQPDSLTSSGLQPQVTPPPEIHVEQDFFRDTLPAADQLMDPYRSAAQAIAPNILNPATPYTQVDDPSFDPFEHIQGYEDTPQAFIGADNFEDVARVKQQIDADRQAQDVMAQSGPMGIVAGLAIGAVDPLSFIPLGAGVKAGRLLDGLYAGAKVGFLTGAAQEAMLQAGHPERTAEDGLFNVAASTVLMGALGGAGRVLADLAPVVAGEARGVPGAVARAAEAVDTDLTIPVGRDELAPGFVEQTAEALAHDTGSVGAAAVRDTNLAQESLKKAYGAERFAKIISPIVRAVTSPSVAVRRIAQDLTETPFRFEKNADGIASPTSVETLTKLWDSALFQAQSGVDRAFLDYRGKGDQIAAMVRTVVTDVLTRQQQALNRPAFMEAVGQAMRRGDQHPNPHVAKAAAHVRRVLIEPLKKEAQALGMLPENIDDLLTTADSYFTRVYNRPKIIAKRPEFETILTNGLKRSQAGATARMTEHAATAAEHEPKVAKFGAEIANAKAERAVIEPIAEAAKGARIARKRDVIAKRALLNEAKKEATAAGKEVEAARKVAMKDDLDKPDSAVKRAVDREMKAEERVVAAEADVKEAEAAFKTAKDTRAAAREKLASLGEVEFQAQKNRRLAEVMRDTATAKADEERAFAAATEEDLRDIARQVTDHVLGMAPGRMQIDAVPLSRGPLKERLLTFVQDTEIEGFLESDVEHIARVYKRSMAPDVELTKRFGRADMADQIAQIQEDYAIKRKGVTDEKILTKLAKREAEDLRDVAAMRDRLRGTYGMPDNPAGFAYRTARVIKDVNVLRLMGGATLSSIADLGRSTMVHGVNRVFSQGVVPMLKNWKQFKLSANEAKLAGAALDSVLHNRSMGLADIFDDYGRLSRFERGLQAATSKFGMFSLLDPWTAAGKQFASVITQTRMLQAITGSTTKAEVERLAMLGIDAPMAKKIRAQFEAHGTDDDGVLWANTAAWTDAEAVTIYRAALVKEVDATIVQPGIGDKPLWMSTTLGSVVGQFRSFSMASTQRVALAGLQQRDAAFLNGSMLSVALGMLSYKVTSEIAGRNTADVDSPTGISRWIGEGFDRSGLLGSLSDVMAIGAKTFGVGWSGSRYSGRGDVDLFLGPTSGLVRDAFTVTAAYRNGTLSEPETKAARRLVPFQNLFYVRWLFDQAEQGLSR